MNPLNVAAITAAWLCLLCAAGRREIGKVLADFRDGLGGRDASTYGGKPAVIPAPQVIQRPRVSDPWAETRAQIEALPETEPFRWIQ